MPKEAKQWSDTLQGHREWTESDLVLAWDSMYECRVGVTKNGKWVSEQRETVEGYIAGTNEVAAILAIPRKEHSKGDKIVVQIMKVNEKEIVL